MRNKITRLEARELMRNNKGQFLSATVITKDGTERKMNGQYMSDNALGYVLIKESGKLKTGKNPIRNLNLQTLKELRLRGQIYKF